ncbi:MAG: hypothetical protein AAGC73_01930 [Verrucomicrobiota bacterium]
MSVIRDVHTLPTSSELPTSAASTLKNAFKSVYGRALELGAISITRNRKSEMVMLPVEVYDQIVAELKETDPLNVLRREYDSIFESMQSDAATQAYDALFDTSTEALGAAALKQARE